jgi:hypothetical protein
VGFIVLVLSVSLVAKQVLAIYERKVLRYRIKHHYIQKDKK